MKDSTTDRELVELAATAAGLKEHGWMGKAYMHVVNNTWATFDVMSHDGDCARLEAAAGIDIEWLEGGVIARCKREFPDGPAIASELFSDHGGDKNAARRLASTKAAAEIGRSHHG